MPIPSSRELLWLISLGCRSGQLSAHVGDWFKVEVICKHEFFNSIPWVPQFKYFVVNQKTLPNAPMTSRTSSSSFPYTSA